MASDPAKPPIFILGVPRSGTTLLRTILDSHSRIACGPETPWLGGHQPRSVMELWRFLREDPHGYSASYRMPGEIVTRATRDFVDRLLAEYARARGKARWAEKTPDNALYAGFLATLFPEARFVHLVRDGLDVALSTSVVEEHRRGISGFLERHLGVGPGVPPLPNTPFNALLKWSHWNRLIESALRGREHLRLSYERLVTEPEATVRALTEFIGEDFEPAMLDYAAFPHEYPSWEWGSADVRARARITGERAGRARRELPLSQRRILEPLARPPETGPAPAVLLRGQAPDEPISLLEGCIAGFAAPLGLDAAAESLPLLAWLWFHGLSRVDLAGMRLLAIGPSRSPLPWMAAMLGARVFIADPPAPDPGLVRLRDQLRLALDWSPPDAAEFDVALITTDAPVPADLLSRVLRARLIACSGSPPGAALPADAAATILVNPPTAVSSDPSA